MNNIKILKNRVRMNPVLSKELKVKMRSWKVAILIGIYNLVLALLTIFIIKLTMNDNMGNVSTQNISATYAFMVAAQFGLISLIAPALTAGAISGEREKQTLDILLSTTLSHWSIITGKLFASLSQIIILIVSSIPVFSIIFLYGGIGVVELLQVFLFYIIVAITLGSIGIFFSTYFKRSTAANVLSYAVVVFLYLGTLFITIFYVQLVIVPKQPNGYYNQTFWLMNFNPAFGLISLVSSQFGQSSGTIFPGISLAADKSGLALWQINALVDIGISVVLLWLSSMKLNPSGKKWSNLLLKIRKM
jgi:ABC-type transport system involved in multi-copper enzyme maturation permease subunit